jgi:glycosyltransferase involved in cell wall biosynthesis
MPQPGLITIVTPSFNMCSYLDDAISSIVSQAEAEYEYFVFDGGSTDDSESIIKKYEEKIDYWVSQPDGGQAAVVEQGLGMARGEVFAWANADDRYLPGTFRYVLDLFAARPEIDILFGGWNFIGPRGNLIDTRTLKGFSLRKFRAGSHVPPQPSVFLRTEAARRVGGINAKLRHAMDYDLYVRIAHQGNIFVTDRILGEFRLHPGSKTQSEKAHQFRELREARSRQLGALASILDRAYWLYFDISEHTKDMLHKKTGMFSLRRGIKEPR